MRNENDKEKFKNDFIKRLIKFSLEIIKLCRELKKQDSLLWSICDQIIRSACSIGANIVEAQSSSSKKDYIDTHALTGVVLNPIQAPLVLNLPDLAFRRIV